LLRVVARKCFASDFNDYRNKGGYVILDITRGHIQIRMGDRIAEIPGEMFIAANGKMGFGIYLDQIKYWEPQTEKQPISGADITAILDDIRAEFIKSGFTLEVDSV
jgi:hypothetical protein